MEIEKIILQKIITEGTNTPAKLACAKREIAQKYGGNFPSNSSLLQVYHKMKGKDERILSLLRTRPIRSLSGVVNVSVLTKPFPCPGECIFCPMQKGAPKSYLKDEPAVMRAIANEYDPQKQIETRIRSLQETGHPTEKIELRIVGGTWSFYSKKYKHWFIKRCFESCNKKESGNLCKAQRENEKAYHRIVCLSIETRPDFITKEEIKELRLLGVTMVELGVQTVFDDILSLCKRGHTIEETRKATHLLKNAGFKICYQMMLGLPGSTPERDIASFREIFKNPDFLPDYLKIYPCILLKEAPLYKLWQKGEYSPPETKELLDTVKKIKREIIPPTVRIQRLFRDIPTQYIAEGCRSSNLREIIAREAAKEGWKCKCIRCREIRDKYKEEEEIRLFKRSFVGSRGKEFFLSIENKEQSKIYALLRLRIGTHSIFPILKDAAIIRELRTYGQHLALGEKKANSPQHQGLGKILIKNAEKIAKRYNKKRIAAISSVGSREYWASCGYRLKDTYMIKDF